MSITTTSPLEQVIQTKIIKNLEKEGYYVIKLSKTNKNGIPDLMAIPKGMAIKFIEVKKKGKEPSPLQHFRIKELNAHGCDASWTDDGINFYINGEPARNNDLCGPTVSL